MTHSPKVVPTSWDRPRKCLVLLLELDGSDILCDEVDEMGEGVGEGQNIFSEFYFLLYALLGSPPSGVANGWGAFLHVEGRRALLCQTLAAQLRRKYFKVIRILGSEQELSWKLQ